MMLYLVDIGVGVETKRKNSGGGGDEAEESGWRGAESVVGAGEGEDGRWGGKNDA